MSRPNHLYQLIQSIQILVKQVDFGGILLPETILILGLSLGCLKSRHGTPKTGCLPSISLSNKAVFAFFFLIFL